MVLLFSERKNRCEKEIIEILKGVGANYISDKCVYGNSEKITIVSIYKKIELNIRKGIIIILDKTEKFNEQKFPKEIIGICEDCNKKALSLFEKNNVSVVTCGLNLKNTVTFSSIDKNSFVVAVQRTLTDLSGREIEPMEYTVKIKRKYSDFSVMVSVIILLLNGIFPKEI